MGMTVECGLKIVTTEGQEQMAQGVHRRRAPEAGGSGRYGGAE